jgi:hypothetical protein
MCRKLPLHSIASNVDLLQRKQNKFISFSFLLKIDQLFSYHNRHHLLLELELVNSKMVCQASRQSRHKTNYGLPPKHQYQFFRSFSIHPLQQVSKTHHKFRIVSKIHTTKNTSSSSSNENSVFFFSYFVMCLISRPLSSAFNLESTNIAKPTDPTAIKVTKGMASLKNDVFLLLREEGLLVDLKIKGHLITTK